MTPELPTNLDPILNEYYATQFQDIPLASSPDQTVLPWNIPPETGQYLYDLVLRTRPLRILEIGTGTGCSGLWMGLAANQYNGHIDTIDYFDDKILIARDWFDRAGLSQTITVHHCRALEYLQTYAGESYDMVFLDADRTSYHKYLPYLIEHTTPHTTIICDNAIDHAHNFEYFIQRLSDYPDLSHELIDVGDGLLCITRT
jgi:predicted O-methyltransferase YrrM